MFEIDLLKGKGRPHKTDLKRVVPGLMILLIPIGAVMVYAAGLQHDHIKLTSLRRLAESNNTRLEDYAEDMRFLTDLSRQINEVSLAITDIGEAMRYRLVASPILVEIAEGLPAEIFLREMNWRRSSQRERKVDNNTGKSWFETVIQRSIKLSLCGYEGTHTDAALQTYITYLETSPALKPLLREIRPALREQTEYDGKSAVFYEIDLFLNEQR